MVQFFGQFRNQIFDFNHSTKRTHEHFCEFLQECYQYVEKKDEEAFLEDIFLNFRSCVNNIRKKNHLIQIKGTLLFVEKNNLHELASDTNNIICFSAPLRFMLNYDQEPIFLNSLKEAYSLFFDKNNVFLNNDSYLIGTTVKEIKDFIDSYILYKHFKFVNTFFSDLNVINYFYERHKDWLNQYKSIPELSNIRNIFTVEHF